MADSLQGLTILVPESRELDLFANMLEEEGARAVRCPLVQILDVEETASARAWIDQLIGGGFDDVVWLTGEGLRRLLAIAERDDRRQAFIDALGRVRTITRGPKPVRALRELGLAAQLAAPVPTSDGVLEALAGEDIKGRRVGVQLYPGDGAQPFVANLRQRGAEVFPVIPYRYASQADTNQVIEAIRALASGQIGMIAFTSSPQVERLATVAREAGLEKELQEALARTPIAAIGPVVEDALHAHGFRAALRPESNFHLKPLVRAIAVEWNRRNG